MKYFYACICLVTATLLALVLISVRQTVVTANSALQDTRELVQETQRRIIDTSKNTNALLIQAGLAADNARRASESQEFYHRRLSTLLDETETSLKALSAAIEHTDTTLNNTLLAQAAATLKSTELVAFETANAVRVTTDGLKPVFDNAAIVLADTSVALRETSNLIGNPDIRGILENVNTVSATAGVLSAEAVKIAQHIEVSTGHIEKAVERSTRPATFAMKAGMFIIDSAGKIGQFFGGLLK